MPARTHAHYHAPTMPLTCPYQPPTIPYQPLPAPYNHPTTPTAPLPPPYHPPAAARQMAAAVRGQFESLLGDQLVTFLGQYRLGLGLGLGLVRVRVS